MLKEKIFNKYVSDVCNKLEVSKEDIFTNTKRRSVVDARQLIYYLCHIRPMRITYIQDYMSRNGYEPPHSTIHYGIKKILNKINTDKDYVELIQKLK
jgi:chromosomal replication initiation ATPase DnaA